MGQYHLLVNLTKKQFVHPHQIGNGLKLREQIGSDCSTATALVMLLAASSGRGGGDFIEHPLIGSWAGDQIAFVGDYSEFGDIKDVNTKLIYDACRWVNCGSVKANIHKRYAKSRPRFMAFAAQWKNISLEVQTMMAAQFNVTYAGDGWMDIRENNGNPVDVHEGDECRNCGHVFYSQNH